MATIPFVHGRGSTPNPWRKTLSLFWDQNQEEFGGWKRYNIFRKKVQLPMNLQSWHLLRPLESIPVSRERVVPPELQVRTILGDRISKAKVITTHAPQYRQHALISDFPDLTRRSSIGHELDQ